METTEPCAVCRSPLAGAYCSRCGAPRPGPDGESLGRILKEQFHEVTSADGKLWRSLRVLFSPGTLTVDYFAGRRTQYLRPIRLFLILNLVLFFVLSFLNQNPMMGELATQRGMIGERGVAASERAQEAWGGDAELFEFLFDQRAGTLGSALVVLMIPGLALLFAIAFRWRAGARTLVFATHALSAVIGLYLGVIALAFLVWGVGSIFGIQSWTLGPWLDEGFVGVIALAVGAYLAVGARRVYGVSWARAGLGAVAITLGGFPALLLGYRVLLFWLTLWTLDLPRT